MGRGEPGFHVGAVPAVLRHVPGAGDLLPHCRWWRGQGRVVKPFSPPCCSSPCIAALNIPALNRYARNAPVVTTCKCGGEGRVVNAPIPGAHLGLAQQTHTSAASRRDTNYRAPQDKDSNIIITRTTPRCGRCYVGFGRLLCWCSTDCATVALMMPMTRFLHTV